MLECAKLTKRYEGKERAAVDSLSLTIGGGEIFGFLGPNGAGKSTTIRMIVGLLVPDSGSISFRGVASTRSVEYKKMIGYCADEPTFYEKMTGREHLSFLSDLYQIEESRRSLRIGELSERMLLTRELSDPISSYSHGMRQKLSVIAALLHEPKLLISMSRWSASTPRPPSPSRHCSGVCRSGQHRLLLHPRTGSRRAALHHARDHQRRGVALSGSFADLRSQNGEGQQSLESLFPP